MVDGSRSKVTPNHIVVIPKGAVHNIINKGEEPLKAWLNDWIRTAFNSGELNTLFKKFHDRDLPKL